MRSLFIVSMVRHEGEWFPPRYILLQWLCQWDVIMVEFCLLPWVAKQPLMENASCLPGILLISLPFIVHCSETWSAQQLLPGEFGKWYWRLRRRTDGERAMWYWWLTVWSQFSSTVQMGKIRREICLRAWAGAWHVKGIFPSSQSHLQPVSKIHATWDYMEKGGMAITEVKNCCMVCSLLPKTVADAELKADEP